MPNHENSNSLGSESLPKQIGSRFWKGSPWNPFCGRVSLAKGARFFLMGYSIFMNVLVVFYIINLTMAVSYLTDKGSHTLQLRGMSGIPGLIDKLGNFKERFHYESLILLIISMLFAALTGIASWQCRKALEQGSVEWMKKWFMVLFIFILLDIIGTLVADCNSFLYSMLLAFPYTVVTILGMLFTYNYILECVQTSAVAQSGTSVYRNIDGEQEQTA